MPTSRVLADRIIRWADVRKKSAVAAAADQHRRKARKYARIANAANCPVIKLGRVSGRPRSCYAAGRENRDRL